MMKYIVKQNWTTILQWKSKNTPSDHEALNAIKEHYENNTRNKYHRMYQGQSPE